MPAFRIVYLRKEGTAPERITAGFECLEQAMNVFAARGLRILYIAEQVDEPRRLGAAVGKAEAAPRSSFPLRRFSARVLA